MDGIVLVDKPSGITSFNVCSLIKRKFNIKKVGHGGTLDPFATGLLIVALNRATKILPHFLDSFKVYTGSIFLGEKRDTCDITGNVVNSSDYSKISVDDIERVRSNFVGLIKQKPPFFSALKHNGKPLYDYARKGVFIDKGEREVNIESFQILDVTLPEVKFSIKCSKGTYIRSIADDFGEQLGVFGYLKDLRREEIGSFNVKDALSPDDIEIENLINIDEIFNYKRFRIKPDFDKLIDNGQILKAEHLENFISDINNNEEIIIKGTNSSVIGLFDGIRKTIKPFVIYKNSLQ